MADTAVETKETTPVSTPEKKVEAVDEESRTSENGETEKPKENGTADEVNGEADEEKTTVENGDSTDSATGAAKRKSGGGDAPEGTPSEVSPEKKAKLDEKVSDEAANGESEVAA